MNIDDKIVLRPEGYNMSARIKHGKIVDHARYLNCVIV